MKGGDMRLLLMGASLMLAVLACGEEPEPAPVADEIAPDTTAAADPVAPAETDTEAAEPDTLVHTEAGTELKFTLEANPTTGYHWVLQGIEQEGEVVRQEGDAVYTGNPNPRGMAGVGGNEEWIFLAVSPGEALIELAYMPPGTGREPGIVWTARVVVQ